MSCVLNVIAILAYASLASAQNPSIRVSSPEHVLELEGGFAFSIQGTGFVDETPTIRIFDGETDVTSQLTVTIDEETRLDPNGDGILESYEAEFLVSLDPYLPDPGRVLRVEASAQSPVGQVVEEDATKVLSHVRVHADGVEFGETDVHVSVRTSKMFINSMDLRVYLGTTDVTAQVDVTGPVTSYDQVDPELAPFVHLRVQYYIVDVSPLGVFQDRLHFVATASGSGRGGTLGDTSATHGIIAEHGELPGGDDCEDALDDFMNALELSGGGGSGDPLSVGATPQEVSDAAKALKDALLDDCSLSGLHTGPGGRTIKYDIGKNTSTSDRKADASGTADVVLAVGGDVGASGSSASGGDATAQNDKPGGVAIAVGGDGSGGADVKGGNGGNAEATITPLGDSSIGDAQALAAGGKGGCCGSGYQSHP